MDMLKILAKREITSCLLEGGPTLAGSFWREGLIDRLVAIIAPKVLADPQGLPMIAGAEVREMSHATELHDVQFKRLGRDLLITGKPCLRV
jgi:diaminohydroxyphosphoribosylaminopyrimidine deaminase/5-amino-6-(5-phosphoribosylamino)uracil reductase